MLRVQPHMADLMIVNIKNENPILVLHEFGRAVGEHEGRALGPALVARVRIADAVESELGVLLHDLRGLRLENGIVVIAVELEDVAGAVLAPRPVDERGRTGWQRLESWK